MTPLCGLISAHQSGLRSFYMVAQGSQHERFIKQGGRFCAFTGPTTDSLDSKQVTRWKECHVHSLTSGWTEHQGPLQKNKHVEKEISLWPS